MKPALKKIITNKKNLSSMIATEGFSIDELNQAYNILGEIIEDKKSSEEKINQLLEIAKESGVDEQDLVRFLSNKNAGKKAGVRPPKYQYPGVDGELKTWTGIGKKPVRLQELLDQGNALEDYLIDKE